MAWELILDDEFAAWLTTLDAQVRVAIAQRFELLKQAGPGLGRPYADTLKGSEHPNMKELRVQVGGEPWRVFFAFDPERSAVVLVGGNKAGDKRFYEINIPIADARYRQHLERLGGTKRRG